MDGCDDDDVNVEMLEKKTCALQQHNITTIL